MAIPDIVIKLGIYVLYVTFSKGITEIKSSDYLSLYNIINVIISGELTAIIGSAFSGCSNLTNIFYYGFKTPSNQSNTFFNSKIENIYVPINYDCE